MSVNSVYLLLGATGLIGTGFISYKLYQRFSVDNIKMLLTKLDPCCWGDEEDLVPACRKFNKTINKYLAELNDIMDCCDDFCTEEILRGHYNIIVRYSDKFTGLQHKFNSQLADADLVKKINNFIKLLIAESDAILLYMTYCMQAIRDNNMMVIYGLEDRIEAHIVSLRKTNLDVDIV